jgi:hypothetical protein
MHSGTKGSSAVVAGIDDLVDAELSVPPSSSTMALSQQPNDAFDIGACLEQIVGSAFASIYDIGKAVIEIGSELVKAVLSGMLDLILQIGRTCIEIYKNRYKPAFNVGLGFLLMATMSFVGGNPVLGGFLLVAAMGALITSWKMQPDPQVKTSETGATQKDIADGSKSAGSFIWEHKGEILAFTACIAVATVNPVAGVFALLALLGKVMFSEENQQEDSRSAIPTIYATH